MMYSQSVLWNHPNMAALKLIITKAIKTVNIDLHQKWGENSQPEIRKEAWPLALSVPLDR